MIRQKNLLPYIENPRNHPDEAVKTLERLLSSGGQMREDPRRPDFFEVDDEDRVFYVYVSPTTSTVILLATWAQELEPAAAG